MKIYKYIRTGADALSITEGNNAFVKVPLPPEGSVSKFVVKQSGGSSAAFAADLFDTKILEEGLHTTALPEDVDLYRVFPVKSATAGATISDYTTGEIGYSYSNDDGTFSVATRCLWLHIRQEPGGGGEGGSGNPSNFPGTATNVSLSSEPWITPENVLLPADDQRALCTLDSNQSDELRTSNYGFAIPDGVIITGIQVEIDRAMDSSGGEIVDTLVQLRKASGALGNNKADVDTIWPELTDDIATYGDSADLWGATWTPAEINDIGFGLAFGCRERGVNPMIAQVDSIKIRVYYVVDTNTTWDVTIVVESNMR